MLDHPARAKFRPPHVKPPTRPLSLWETARMSRQNALSTIPEIAYSSRILSGKTGFRWHIVCSPDANRQVLLDNVENYPKSRITQRILEPAIGRSIFTSHGEEWRWQRRAAAPIFTPRKMMSLTPMMTEAATRTSERLEGAIARGFEGRGVADIMEEMVAATYQIVCDALLSGAEGLDRREIGQAITRYLETIAKISVFDMLDLPHWIPRPAQVLNRGVTERSGQMIAELIAQRRKAPPRQDLLGFMLEAQDPESGQRMDDATLANNLFSFIVAGHETTALALAWSLYLLAHDENVQERAAAEARAAIGQGPARGDHLEALPYCRQVIEEAMRLFPPAAMISREAVARDTLLGREIEPGDMVIMPIYTLHRHSHFWEDPMHFDPEHFAPEKVKARDRYLYLPFGAGPRICIGMGFALWEAQIILATLLARFRFLPKGGTQPEPVMTITLRPKGGMPLKIERRG
ncbi:MAG: cytochrome P450 [Neomegalonema sp.]|nr:cytochrome P450 [Neomegalonema sp.]